MLRFDAHGMPKVSTELWQQAMQQLSVAEEEALMADGFSFDEVMVLAVLRLYFEQQHAKGRL